MKAESISNIRRELKEKDAQELYEICLSLCKHNLENKELATYLLFEKVDEDAFVKSALDTVGLILEEAHYAKNYRIGKIVRKAQTRLLKFIKFSKLKKTEVELKMGFLTLLIEENIPYYRSHTASNLFNRVADQIMKTLLKLDEDLQHDFGVELEQILERKRH